jgi:hypothetical protein
MQFTAPLVLSDEGHQGVEHVWHGARGYHSFRLPPGSAAALCLTALAGRFTLRASMDPQPTLFVGRVSDVGPTYVVVGATRIELRDKEMAAAFHLGHSVSVMALAVDGRYISGKIVPSTMGA